ncbi:Phytoene dehydrogenase-related protein [Pedococcus dokdonensis]|uniref:Pyridine nucleotide-disulfide oxidoreductase domain-containing protein 2 n=1 Tax=Pedococcus dokdonensis TaxID=443156 RepID=A0A1H0PUV2_9MICO|nr:NAD(P)/FAD-dependent oxidoreductase [Pedococcus dokdonensis]SDP08600.1 Phytoene dehydrogenase-related protein [Pedococcus dokdonensis]
MDYDDVVIGAGHNGLAAAAYLARAGRRVLVLEAADHVGGAAVSAQAFAGVDARLSRYSYLVSLLPRELITDLDLDVQLIRRRFSSFTPVPARPTRGLLVDHGDPEATAAGFAALTEGSSEYAAWQRFYARVQHLAERVFPTVLEPLRTETELAGLVGDDELWEALVRRPLGEVLEAEFGDDTVRGIVATDALIGTFARMGGADLRQNVCFLYHLIGGGTGDWDVPVGGMGSVTDGLARAAVKAGAEIRTSTRVVSVDPDGGVSWEGGSARAGTVHAACAPTVLNALLAAAGADPVPTESAPEGAQLKVNMLLTRLPRLRDESVDPAAAFAGTFHINEGYAQLDEAYAAAEAGRVPQRPPCEIYCHSLSDRSILGPSLAATEAQTLTLFGLHLPARLFRGTAEEHDAVKDLALARTLESLNSVLAEPIQDVLLRDPSGDYCLEARTPVELEADLGLPGGNIFHRSLQWPWAETEAEVGTWGVETPHDKVRIAGAGARRGGGVSGIPGHNSAMSVLKA